MSRRGRALRGFRRGPDPQLALGACPACRAVEAVQHGALVRHLVAVAGPDATVTQRRCPGSGGAPRRIENVELPDA